MVGRELAFEIFWALTRRKGWVASRIDSLCSHYRAAFSDMSYDMDRNGEAVFVRRLGPLRPRVIFDVGANVGDWARFAMSQFPAASIHAFELSPRTFAILKGNLGQTSARLNGFGLSDKPGPVEFRSFGDGSAISTMVDSEFHASIRYDILAAEVTTGDAYCESAGIEQIDLLKIDVEGAEMRVLSGFDRMLREHRIRCLQFEYGYANGDDHVLMRDFHRTFEARGYIVGRLWSKGVAFGPFAYAQNQFTSGPNYVAIRHDDAACRKLIEAQR